MKESGDERRARLHQALDILRQTYPDAKPALEFSSAFELLVATMLSAQSTDKQVNRCTRLLFPMYNTPEQIACLREEELIPYIKGCGLFQTKGKNIIATSRILVEEYGGAVPEDRDALTKLPGVGRKTANVVLSNAFGVDAIAVDTHVFRVANRIGLAEAKDVLRTEKQLMENIPKEQWSIAHHWLIYHGRRVCAAQRPACGVCPLSSVCRDYIERQENHEIC